MEVEVKAMYGEQEYIIKCPNHQVGRFLFEQVSKFINLSQEKFELLICSELGNKNLLKDYTLSQQDFSLEYQNYLLVQPKIEAQPMPQEYNNNTSNQQLLQGVKLPFLNVNGQGQFPGYQQQGDNKFNMIQDQMPKNAQNQNQFSNYNSEQNTNKPQGPPSQYLQGVVQGPPFAQNQLSGSTNQLIYPNQQLPGLAVSINAPQQFPGTTGLLNVPQQHQGPPQIPNLQYPTPPTPFPGAPTQMPNPQFPPQFQFPAQYPPINPNNIMFPPKIPTTIPHPQIQADKQIKEQLQNQIKEYEDNTTQLEEKNKQQESQIKKLKDNIDQLKKDHEDEMQNQTKRFKEEQNKAQDDFNNKNQQQQRRIKSLNDEIEDLKENNLQLEQDLTRQKQLQNRQTTVGVQISNFAVPYEQNIINELRSKNTQLIKQGRDKDTKIQELEQEIIQLKAQLENGKDQQNMDQLKKNQEFNKLFQDQSQQFKMLQDKVNELSHQALVEQKKREDRDKEILKLKEKVSDLENQIELKVIEINNDKKIIQFIKEGVNKNIDQNNKSQFMPQFNQELQRLQEDMQREIADKKKQEEIRKEQEQLKQKEQNAEYFKVKQEREQQVKLERQKKACKLREGIMNTQGILQVGLLVDVTGSMDKYKDATMNIIQRTMGCIKSQTNRDCEWGTVCYQDFAELKQKGQYMQHQFTRDSNQIINFLKNIACDGGDDGAEDLRNGIKQMLSNLKWEKYFKIALLICDAPCHGSKWAGKVLDDYPNEDLEDALQLLINKNIVLIGIEFAQSTDVMFAQMKNFYAKQNKQSMLIIVDLKNRQPDQIQDQLINIISEASISITEINQQGTKTKKENVKRDGAFEALVKLLPDPTKFNLDPNITTIQTNFKVFRVEIKQKAFENNLSSIYKLKVPDDYSQTLESEWKCIRTLKPFAFGQLKEVYLMKKQDKNSEDEVYVIKMPIGGQTYKTINEALLECRSHLISQRLMQKFMSDLNDKGFQNFKIKYSDFLILQEHETSFWIAERFFKGDFVKFNNNYGYINPNQDQLNIIAQVFSYYTYHISDFQYMICDVQGVGYNFTDPAINTSEGNFDETDLGPEGIGQYIISFEMNKATCYQKYLDLLDLKD